MATLTIRQLDERTKAKLRVRAARHGRSMEQEAREILRSALVKEDRSGASLFEAIRKRIEPLGGVELELPKRGPIREVSFDE
jgi:plasmid stability protein